MKCGWTLSVILPAASLLLASSKYVAGQNFPNCRDRAVHYSPFDASFSKRIVVEATGGAAIHKARAIVGKKFGREDAGMRADGHRSPRIFPHPYGWNPVTVLPPTELVTVPAQSLTASYHRN
jgi:hypothetical protein